MGGRTAAVVCAVAVAGGLGAVAPVHADPVVPYGITGWVSPTVGGGPAFDGVYIRRVGSRITLAHVSGLEGYCQSGRIRGNTARVKSFGYGKPSRARLTFSLFNEGRLLITTHGGKRTYKFRVTPVSLGDARSLLNEGRQANMSARSLLRGC